MHFADFIRSTGKKQDALGYGGLTGIYVGTDTDISDFAYIFGHYFPV